MMHFIFHSEILECLYVPESAVYWWLIKKESLATHGCAATVVSCALYFYYPTNNLLQFIRFRIFCVIAWMSAIGRVITLCLLSFVRLYMFSSSSYRFGFGLRILFCVVAHIYCCLPGSFYFRFWFWIKFISINFNVVYTFVRIDAVRLSSHTRA